MGFFTQAETITKAPPSTIAKCGECGLYKKCLSPKMEVIGEGRRKVLVVGEAPGKNEDEKGIPFIGKAGQRLREEFEDLDWDLEEDCWVTNSVICRPEDNKIEDRFILSCRPNLNRTITKLQPEVIVLLGGSAVKSLIGQDWVRDVGSLERWVGWTIPHRRLNAWVCPTYHPSYLERKDDPVLDLWFRNYLKEALSKEGKPYPDEVPDISKKVKVELSPSKAAKILRSQELNPNIPIAFDYETNMLKPDSEKARIYSCAICFGDWTLAYPWEGEAIEATREILRSKVRKVIANAKFEQRWTKTEFGHGVKNVYFDTMQAAHILDNRPKITSVKFQAFVRLGIVPWDEYIHEFLKAKGGNAVNRIRDIPIADLLLYNGIDSQVEWELAQIQMKEIGI